MGRAPALPVLVEPPIRLGGRDGDARAAWLELDTESWQVTYHRVAYEIDRAAEAIERAGLPEHLAKRLFVGR